MACQYLQPACYTDSTNAALCDSAAAVHMNRLLRGRPSAGRRRGTWVRSGPLWVGRRRLPALSVCLEARSERLLRAREQQTRPPLQPGACRRGDAHPDICGGVACRSARAAARQRRACAAATAAAAAAAAPWRDAGPRWTEAGLAADAPHGARHRPVGSERPGGLVHACTGMCMRRGQPCTAVQGLIHLRLNA